MMYWIRRFFGFFVSRAFWVLVGVVALALFIWFAGPLFAFALKRAAGFGGEGFRGFEQTAASLQERCYLLCAGFGRRSDRFGREYGWSVTRYDTPERRFGPAYIDSAYAEEPEASLSRLTDRALSAFPALDRAALTGLITRVR